jgi:hypothetical protein
MAPNSVCYRHFSNTNHLVPPQGLEPWPFPCAVERPTIESLRAVWQIDEKSDSVAMAMGVIQQNIDPGLKHFRHEKELYGSDHDSTARIRRTQARAKYRTYESTLTAAIRAVLAPELRPATVFGNCRLMVQLLVHVVVSAVLCIVYYFITATDDTLQDVKDFLPGVKDFADLCVTGIVFLLGGFVTTMLTRWWAVRSQCCGGLHQALHSLCLYASIVWPTASDVDREARGLVTRSAPSPPWPHCAYAARQHTPLRDSASLLKIAPSRCSSLPVPIHTAREVR